MGTTLKQAGAIPYRVMDGAVQVLLVTSRDTGRWIIPKGHIEPGQSPRAAAAQEALEEAGVIGRMTTKKPLGVIHYEKTLKTGKKRAAQITVYPLHVARQKNIWHEKGQRTVQWFTISEAISKASDQDLVNILTQLSKILR